MGKYPFPSPSPPIPPQHTLPSAICPNPFTFPSIQLSPVHVNILIIKSIAKFNETTSIIITGYNHDKALPGQKDATFFSAFEGAAENAGALSERQVRTVL
jgi:hypothetical protein